MGATTTTTTTTTTATGRGETGEAERVYEGGTRSEEGGFRGGGSQGEIGSGRGIQAERDGRIRRKEEEEFQASQQEDEQGTTAHGKSDGGLIAEDTKANAVVTTRVVFCSAAVVVGRCYRK